LPVNAVTRRQLHHARGHDHWCDAASAEDLDLYQRTAKSLRRLLEAVGLQRRPRDVTPDPLPYAREVTTDRGSP
jgi:hypothetical protein